MNKTLIFSMLLLITIMMTIGDADGERCSSSTYCNSYCWKKAKCTRGKCINKECKCYNCGRGD
uniref:Putative K+ channel toxin n=1 Tax=Superstitionia donensis TaxID=311983 RepID=A0A1V1WBW9_9SCOR